MGNSYFKKIFKLKILFLHIFFKAVMSDVNWKIRHQISVGTVSQSKWTFLLRAKSNGIVCKGNDRWRHWRHGNVQIYISYILKCDEYGRQVRLLTARPRKLLECMTEGGRCTNHYEILLTFNNPRRHAFSNNAQLKTLPPIVTSVVCYHRRVTLVQINIHAESNVHE